MDPTLNNSSGAGTMILNAFEGLMVLDENDQPVEGTAESMEVSEDGLVYTFKIREDAKWSDGEAVTADNFKYSWLSYIRNSNCILPTIISIYNICSFKRRYSFC